MANEEIKRVLEQRTRLEDCTSKQQVQWYRLFWPSSRTFSSALFRLKDARDYGHECFDKRGPFQIVLAEDDPKLYETWLTYDWLTHDSAAR